MLLRPNLASIAFRATVTVQCTAMYNVLPTRRNVMYGNDPSASSVTAFNMQNDFLCKIWSDPDLNMDFEIFDTCTCYKKYYLVLTGPNMASIAFSAHYALTPFYGPPNWF